MSGALNPNCLYRVREECISSRLPGGCLVRVVMEGATPFAADVRRPGGKMRHRVRRDHLEPAPRGEGARP